MSSRFGSFTVSVVEGVGVGDTVLADSLSKLSFLQVIECWKFCAWPMCAHVLMIEIEVFSSL